MAVTLAFLGDVMLGRGVALELSTRPPASFWGTTLPVLRAANGVIANLECAVTSHQTPWQRTPKVFHFRARPEAAAVLEAGRIRAVTLANNHTLDFEVAGLRDTLRSLDAAGIHHAGAGLTREEAGRPAVFQVGPLRVGLVSLTDNEPAFAAGPHRPGTAYTVIDDSPATLAALSRLIGQARGAGADLVVLGLHWGPNMVEEPPWHHRAFARAAIDRGADLVFGHSSHVFQGVEAYGRGLILYDTGDFLDDYAVDPALRNDWSFIFLVEAGPRGLTRLVMRPVRLRYARVDLATSEEFEAIRQLMSRRCQAIGTRLEPVPEGLALTLNKEETTMAISFGPHHEERSVQVTAGPVTLEGDLGIPPGAKGIVLFAHGSGSSRKSSRNRYVAQVLRNAGLGTLLIDLLTPDEEVVDLRTAHLRFNIPMLAERLVGATDWLKQQPETRDLRVGLFGASTGGGAALVAAAQQPADIAAVVSRGGRPDLAGEALPDVQAPTLLLVGGEDGPVIEMNQEAFDQLHSTKELTIIPGATHLFEEPGTLEEVARQAAAWFSKYLSRAEVEAR